MKMTTGKWVTLGAIILVLLGSWSSYNGFVSREEIVGVCVSALSNVDVGDGGGGSGDWSGGFSGSSWSSSSNSGFSGGGGCGGGGGAGD